MTDKLFIASSTFRNANEIREIILDAMDGYDGSVYSAEIAAGRIEQLVTEEWDNAWTQGDGVFTNEAEAHEYVAAENEAGRHLKVIEITRDHIRAALEAAYGDE